MEGLEQNEKGTLLLQRQGAAYHANDPGTQPFITVDLKCSLHFGMLDDGENLKGNFLTSESSAIYDSLDPRREGLRLPRK